MQDVEEALGQILPGPGFQACPVWRSLSSVGASIGDPFEGAGMYCVVYHFMQSSCGEALNTAGAWLGFLTRPEKETGIV